MGALLPIIPFAIATALAAWTARVIARELGAGRK